MKVKILDQAEDDLLHGFAFYEEQQSGLGTYFQECLFADIDALSICSGSHRIAYRNFHRSLSKRFPFAIFYAVANDTAYIHAIVDCRRQPTWIKRHLRDA